MFAMPEKKGDSDTCEGITTFVSRFLNQVHVDPVIAIERNRFAPSDVNLIIVMQWLLDNKRTGGSSTWKDRWYNLFLMTTVRSRFQFFTLINTIITEFTSL